MIAAKKFFIGLLAAIILNVAAAHAEEVDPYFTWEIKNLDDYQRHDLLIKTLNSDGISGIRDDIYKKIALGRYLEAIQLVCLLEPYQKIIFGVDYFDADLTELAAKLYLVADELDAAERKINLLCDNAVDSSAKIRALNLKSNFLNRRGNYTEALQVAQETDELLKIVPDEKLSLINNSHRAQAYCGLGDIEKASKVTNVVLPQMPEYFGEYSPESLALLSTNAELCLKNQKSDIAETILKYKVALMVRRYNRTNDNFPAVVDSMTELADFYFAVNNAEQGENILNKALSLADKCAYELHDILNARILYKKINKIATENLHKDHPTALESEYGFVYITSDTFGDALMAIEFYEKKLPTFKKVFGEDNVDTLNIMNLLSGNYLLLGKYADAKKVAEERLRLCRKHFGDHDSRTLDATIDLAEIYYCMGKYTSADKLQIDVLEQNAELIRENPTPEFVYQLLFKKARGEFMRGDIPTYSQDLNSIRTLLSRNKNAKYRSSVFVSLRTVELLLEANKLLSTVGFAHNAVDMERFFLNTMNIAGIEYNPNNLKLMINIAELQIKYSNFDEAARYANQVLKLSRSHLGGNNLIEWTALNTLSKIRRAENKFTDALDLDKQALQIAENVCGKKSLERLQSLDAMASDLAGDNLAEAIKIRERALTEYKKILEDTDAATVQMMTNLAENYVTAGRYADAIKLCDETLAAQKIPIYTNNHLNFYPSVTELIRIKAKAQKLSGNNSTAWTNYKNLIQVYEANRIAGSRMETYLSGGENKSKWFATVVPVYEVAAEVAAANVDADFAFYCTEFCKGRNLLDQFNDVLVAKEYLLTSNEKNILDEYKNLLQSAQALYEYAENTNNDELFIYTYSLYNGLHTADENFKDDLRKKYSNNMIDKNSRQQDDKQLNFGFWDQLDLSIWEQPSIWDWNEILKNFDVRKNSAAIPNGACLIEFLKASDNSLVVTFLSNDGEVQAANISVDEKFFDDCKLYHDLISYPDINSMSEFGKKYLWQIGDEYKITDIREKTVADENSVKDDSKFIGLRQKLCAELSEKLLPTLERFAGKFSYWIISPDAELNLVPFETLTCRGKFLVDEKNVSYVPSLAVMNLMRNRERKNSYLGRNKELFAMGDAIYSDNDETATRGSFDENFNLAGLKWSNLPGAARELDKVSALFESKNIFRREQASEKNLRQLNSSGELSQYKYLLFSAHGIFVPQRPELSSIVLSQNFDAEFDGYVTVGEWMSYDLRSDLIYLSACESGRGSYQAGEGIVGIPYALTVAGNKDTVMSLWKVNDAATAEFTSAVFEKLSRGKSEVDAINETKREFLSNPIYRDPSIWAAFVLYGI